MATIYDPIRGIADPKKRIEYKKKRAEIFRLLGGNPDSHKWSDERDFTIANELYQRIMEVATRKRSLPQSSITKLENLLYEQLTKYQFGGLAQKIRREVYHGYVDGTYKEGVGLIQNIMRKEVTANLTRKLGRPPTAYEVSSEISRLTRTDIVGIRGIRDYAPGQRFNFRSLTTPGGMTPGDTIPLLYHKVELKDADGKKRVYRLDEVALDRNGQLNDDSLMPYIKIGTPDAEKIRQLENALSTKIEVEKAIDDGKMFGDGMGRGRDHLIDYIWTKLDCAGAAFLKANPTRLNGLANEIAKGFQIRLGNFKIAGKTINIRDYLRAHPDEIDNDTYKIIENAAIAAGVSPQEVREQLKTQIIAPDQIRVLVEGALTDFSGQEKTYNKDKTGRNVPTMDDPGIAEVTKERAINDLTSALTEQVMKSMFKIRMLPDERVVEGSTDEYKFKHLWVKTYKTQLARLGRRQYRALTAIRQLEHPSLMYDVMDYDPYWDYTARQVAMGSAMRQAATTRNFFYDPAGTLINYSLLTAVQMTPGGEWAYNNVLRILNMRNGLLPKNRKWSPMQLRNLALLTAKKTLFAPLYVYDPLSRSLAPRPFYIINKATDAFLDNLAGDEGLPGWLDRRIYGFFEKRAIRKRKWDRSFLKVIYTPGRGKNADGTPNGTDYSYSPWDFRYFRQLTRSKRKKRRPTLLAMAFDLTIGSLIALPFRYIWNVTKIGARMRGVMSFANNYLSGENARGLGKAYSLIRSGYKTVTGFTGAAFSGITKGAIAAIAAGIVLNSPIVAAGAFFASAVPEILIKLGGNPWLRNRFDNINKLGDALDYIDLKGRHTLELGPTKTRWGGGALKGVLRGVQNFSWGATIGFVLSGGNPFAAVAVGLGTSAATYGWNRFISPAWKNVISPKLLMLKGIMRLPLMEAVGLYSAGYFIKDLYDAVRADISGEDPNAFENWVAMNFTGLGIANSVLVVGGGLLSLIGVYNSALATVKGIVLGFGSNLPYLSNVGRAAGPWVAVGSVIGGLIGLGIGLLFGGVVGATVGGIIGGALGAAVGWGIGFLTGVVSAPLLSIIGASIGGTIGGLIGSWIDRSLSKVVGTFGSIFRTIGAAIGLITAILQLASKDISESGVGALMLALSGFISVTALATATLGGSSYMVSAPELYEELAVIPPSIKDFEKTIETAGFIDNGRTVVFRINVTNTNEQNRNISVKYQDVLTFASEEVQRSMSYFPIYVDPDVGLIEDRDGRQLILTENKEVVLPKGEDHMLLIRYTSEGKSFPELIREMPNEKLCNRAILTGQIEGGEALNAETVICLDPEGNITGPGGKCPVDPGRGINICQGCHSISPKALDICSAGGQDVNVYSPVDGKISRILSPEYISNIKDKNGNYKYRGITGCYDGGWTISIDGDDGFHYSIWHVMFDTASMDTFTVNLKEIKTGDSVSEGQIIAKVWDGGPVDGGLDQCYLNPGGKKGGLYTNTFWTNPHIHFGILKGNTTSCSMVEDYYKNNCDSSYAP